MTAQAKQQTAIPEKYRMIDRQYQLKSSSTPLEYILPSRNTKAFSLLYYDPDFGNRALRYARNQKTPFEDEQDGNALVEPVIFENGYLVVSKRNPVLQWFLDLHPLKDRTFKEVDKNRDAEQELIFMDSQESAIDICRKMDDSDIKSLSLVLFGRGVKNKSANEQKVMVRKYARNNPKEFLKAFNDPSLQHTTDIYRYFDAKLIEIKFGNQVFVNLPTRKEKIMNLPKQSSSKREYLVSEFLKQRENLDILTALQREFENIEENPLDS